MPNAFPPGPKPHALVGNLPEFRKDPLDFFTACARQYGEVVHYHILNVNAYLLNHPDLIEYVLVRNNHNFIKGRLFRANHLLLGNGLVTSEGDFWKRQRRLAQPAFHRDRLAGYAGVMTEYAERLGSNWQDGETRDIHLEMKHLSLQIIAKTLFGADITQEARVAGSALHTVSEAFTARLKSGLLIPEEIPTPGNLRLRKAIRQLDEIIYGLILQRRTGDQQPDDLLSLLLAAQDEDGSQMTDRQLRDEVMTLFVAGYETTAVTLTWTWYLLAQHPAAEQRLLDELDRVLGGRSPGLTDIPRLAYTDMVLKESMRLYPPVWGIPRIAVQDCEIGGYVVPAGTSLTISQWVMHRNPRYFDDPDAFKPERWENDLLKSLPAFVYFPFGGGPRQCIGQSFATMEAILVIATIARKFCFRLAPDQIVKPWPSITLYPRYGIKMMINRRTSPS